MRILVIIFMLFSCQSNAQQMPNILRHKDDLQFYISTVDSALVYCIRGNKITYFLQRKDKPDSILTRDQFLKLFPIYKNLMLKPYIKQMLI